MLSAIHITELRMTGQQITTGTVAYFNHLKTSVRLRSTRFNIQKFYVLLT